MTGRRRPVVLAGHHGRALRLRRSDGPFRDQLDVHPGLRLEPGRQRLRRDRRTAAGTPGPSSSTTAGRTRRASPSRPSATTTRSPWSVPSAAAALQLDSLGAYPLAFDGVDVGDDLYAFGYPADAALRRRGPDLLRRPARAGPRRRESEPVLRHDRRCLRRSVAARDRRPRRARRVRWRRSAPTGSNGDAHLYGPAFDGRHAAVYEPAKGATPDADGHRPPHRNGRGGVGHAVHGHQRLHVQGRHRVAVRLEASRADVHPTLFCPRPTSTREQMAAFLVRALDLPATAPTTSPTTTTIHEPKINSLRRSASRPAVRDGSSARRRT